MPFDDDADVDVPGTGRPPHPDDRLWRHPSEMNDHPIAPIGPPSPPLLISTPSADGAPGRRPWGAFLVAATLGAVVAGGGVMALGVGERVVDRPVTERVVIDPAALPSATSQSDTLEGLRQEVGPAVVGVVPSGDGSQGPGSGVLVRDDGILVTSAAFVATGTVPDVRLPDGTVAAAELVGTDPVTGLAVLDVAGVGHLPSMLAATAGLSPGTSTFVLNAQGDEPAATTSGTVALTERFVGPQGSALDGIAVAGDAGPAALGGPAVNQQGAVVGVVTAVEDGAWYVAPVEVAHRVADSLLAEGVVRHCWLGIEGTDVRGAAAGTETTLPTEGGGTKVASVVPDSPADRGGLVPGDVIVALDGDTVSRMPDLTLGLRSRAPGDRVDVTAVRADGSKVTLVLTLDEAPEPTA